MCRKQLSILRKFYWILKNNCVIHFPTFGVRYLTPLFIRALIYIKKDYIVKANVINQPQNFFIVGAVKQIEINKRGMSVAVLREKRDAFLSYQNLMFLLIMLLILLQPLNVSASIQTKEMEAGNVCQYMTEKMERKYNIKKHLLTTIASVESGRWNEKKQQKNAWPWTINAQGKGYFFNSKAEAIKKARELRAKGVTSIDVGCMQINMMYHGKEFSSLEEAFDPMHNVEYAAKFLKRLYETNDHDWMKAATTYHSSVPEKANAYRKKIVKTFESVKSMQKEADLLARPSKATKKTAKLRSKSNLKKIASDKIPTMPRQKNNRKKLDVNAWREAKLEEYMTQKILARKY